MIHFVVPFYNNEKNLEDSILILSEFLAHHLKEDYEIVLSNDGSQDRSLEIAQKLADSIPKVRLVSYSPNRGRGFAVKHASRSCQGEFLIYADVDFPQTTRLEHILPMLDCLRRNQIVVGSRFLKDSRTQRIWLRKVVGIIHRLMIKTIFFGLGVEDPDVGFKGFMLPALKRMIAVSRMDRWSWDLEMLVIARRNGLSIAEIPIDWNEKYEQYVSSVRLFRDAWEELMGMIRIKTNLVKRLYDF